MVNEEMISDNESERTTKSVSRAFDKHCTAETCDGKFISGPNWAIHTDRIHSDGKVSYETCHGVGCTHCKQG